MFEAPGCQCPNTKNQIKCESNNPILALSKDAPFPPADSEMRLQRVANPKSTAMVKVHDTAFKSSLKCIGKRILDFGES